MSLERPHDFDENNLKVAFKSSPTATDWNPDKEIIHGEFNCLDHAVRHIHSADVTKR